MWEQHIQKELEDLAHIDQKRSLQMVEHADRPWLSMNGRRMLNLVSNNYLGLAGHRRLKDRRRVLSVMRDFIDSPVKRPPPLIRLR
jgi:7-keto-8-aminopelargonate synthetase-like enzyme